MSEINKNQICTEAELFFLSIIYGSEYGQVPQHIQEHILTCSICKNRIDELKNNLQEKDGSLQDSQSQIQSTLKVHLNYAGQEVGCDTVKPFLPDMLKQKISVPTPITVHIDRCPACQKDLAAIEAMRLKDKQLEILSSALSSKTNEDCATQTDIAQAIQLFINFEFDKISPQLLEHLCGCRLCQLLIHKARAKKLQNLQPNNNSICESVSDSDLFDYLLPDKIAYQNKTLIEHLRQCPVCLGRLQKIHEEIYSICNRLESAIKTIYNLSGDKDLTASAAAADTYEGFPVNVQTIISYRNMKKHWSFAGIAKGVKYLTKIAAAAVIIMAVSILIYNIPSATAVSIEQVYQAIQKAVNIHITRYTPDSIEPIQERWISKSLRLYILKTSEGTAVWDLSNRKHILRAKDSLATEVFSLSETAINNIRQKITGPLELTPFENISQIPADAKWNKINGVYLEGSDVYELLWTRITQGQSLLAFKWRVYIDKQTQLPSRVELYQKLPDEAEYNLITANEIKYLSDEDIINLLGELGLEKHITWNPIMEYDLYIHH
ncbi:MAG: hypothetical protein WCZ89_02135 [Phycisphaerae bacterium]